MSAKTWVALLRGINLGRRKRVAMADLRALLESLGYEDVRTHLQSGNAVFNTTGAGRELERQIAARIESDLGFDVKVLVRTGKQLTDVVDANPFATGGTDEKELHAVFLSAKPPARKVAKLDRDEFEPDRVEFGDRVIYVHLPNGVMGSRLPDWERLFGLDATMRTWRTVTRLNGIAG